MHEGSRARREASDEHPFGDGRERSFWAFVVALEPDVTLPELAR